MNRVRIFFEIHGFGCLAANFRFKIVIILVLLKNLINFKRKFIFMIKKFIFLLAIRVKGLEFFVELPNFIRLIALYLYFIARFETFLIEVTCLIL